LVGENYVYLWWWWIDIRAFDKGDRAEVVQRADREFIQTL